MIQHKHKGVERSNGSLRSHPITRIHKDSSVVKQHNKVLNSKQGKYKQGVTKTKKKVAPKKTKKSSQKFEISKGRNTILVPVDKQGYISLNLDKSKTKGLRLTFTRNERGRSKTVGIQFENHPSNRSARERLKVDRSY